MMIKKYMHKNFFCGNATFKTRLSPLVKMPSVIMSQSNPKYEKIVLKDLNVKNQALRDEIKNMNAVTSESILLKKKMEHDFIKGKLEEIEYDRNRLFEMKEQRENTKIRLLESNSLNTIRDINERAYYCYNMYDWDKESLDDSILSDKLIPYRISTIKHGFSGFIFEKNGIKYVAFTLHTSKSDSMLFNLPIPNLELKEELNPIKFVNPMHFMKLDTFKQLFTLESPRKLFTKAIFENVEMHDAAYCAFRAAMASTTQCDYSICLITPDKSLKRLKLINSTFIDHDGKILTPAQMISGELNVSFEEDFAEGLQYMTAISDDKEGKEGLIISAQNVYEDNF